MSKEKMHVDEIDIDTDLVQRLIGEQFPQWSGLPIKPVVSSGTDNAIYRLGDSLAARLPRHLGPSHTVQKEQEWLPKLAPYLPLPVSTPLAKGMPSEEYPFYWSVCNWLEGQNAIPERLIYPNEFATRLANFILALQKIDPAGGPIPGGHNFYRGVPLATRDQYTRSSIESLGSQIDTELVTAAWEESLVAPIWQKAPVWIHGDLQSGNLLVREGQLSGVIDFGGLGVGDPACDLQVAWNLLSGEARATFREAMSVDDATWTRGRGWALSVALIALPYYQTTNPTLAEISRYTIGEVLEDFRPR